MSRIKFSFTIQHLWGLIILVGIFVFVNTHPVRPYDFWWHIAVGKEILTTGKIPGVDIYSFTQAGQPYPSYQMFWLMEIVLYGLYRAGGPALVVFFQSLIVTSAYIILFWICKRASQSWRIAALSVIFAAALGLNDWNVRPQGITFLLASLILMAIYEYRRNPHWAWLPVIPLSMLVWVNSHGTFIIGLILVGIWWGDEIWSAVIHCIRHDEAYEKKRLIIPGVVFAITTLVCMINPRGVGILDYVRTLTSNSVVQNLVTEWAPPSFTSLMGILFFSGLILCALVLVVSPKRPNFFQLATFILFAILGLRTSRGSVWFGLVMAPIVADHLASISSRYFRRSENLASQEGSKILNYLIAFLVILLGIISLPWFKSYLPLPSAKAGLISSETPVEATDSLLELKPPGNLFNSMTFGSYLIWSAYPQYRVFTDSRIELFPTDVWMDYLEISSAVSGWQGLLSNYGVNTLMLSPEDQPLLIKAAETSGEWKLIYQDDAAYIFIRESSSQ